MRLRPEAEGIGEFARWGFIIKHRSEYIVELHHQGKLVSVFTQLRARDFLGRAGCLVQEEYSNRRIGHLYWYKGEPFALGLLKRIHVFGHSYPACATVPRYQYVTSRWYPNCEGLEHQLDEVSAEASKSQSLEVEKSIGLEVNKSRSQQVKKSEVRLQDIRQAN